MRTRSVTLLRIMSTNRHRGEDIEYVDSIQLQSNLPTAASFSLYPTLFRFRLTTSLNAQRHSVSLFCRGFVQHGIVMEFRFPNTKTAGLQRTIQLLTT